MTDVLGRVDNLVAELDALRLHLIRQIEASEVWRHDLNGTANSWLRSQHGHDHRSVVRTALRRAGTRDVPALRAAADAGLISRAHRCGIVVAGEATPTRRVSTSSSSIVGVWLRLRKRTTFNVAEGDASLGRSDRPDLDLRDEADAHHRRYLHVNHVGRCRA